MIYLRHRYSDQAEFTYDIGAWLARPNLPGPNKPVAIKTTPENEDAKVDEVLKRANDTFGQPGVMCPPIPTEQSKALKLARRKK